MKRYIKFLFFALLSAISLPAWSQEQGKRVCFEFYDKVFNLEFDQSIIINAPEDLSGESVKVFYENIDQGTYQPVIDSLTAYKQKHQLNDWLYYQLVRKVAEQVSPKAQNYNRYTLYKWFFMAKSGYDARLALANKQLIFYILNDEDVSDLPYFIIDKKQYTTLNYHDLGQMDLHQNPPVPIGITVPGANRPFSYKVTRMPDFNAGDYVTKELNFKYRNKNYNFSVKLNPDIEKLFTNYPIVDFETYFNIPLSKETYSSVIPFLSKSVKGMSQQQGVDYLMRFTRYAFLYENDEQNYGKEKRLSPEETLFADYSDCDDRAALFFYLVKEIYDLPMIAVLYATHINIAVQFNKPVGTQIIYKGRSYSTCEPTPQLKDLNIGQLSARLKNSPYKVVYSYEPISH
ncbi:hypothetical protein [Mucilaginibacter sp.]|uniref:hypothetical protein n=1 Tax=Mucilaginibacter sp. TaxID=1882438 RepID=UPI0035BBCB6B